MKSYVVGGAVRDRLLGLPVADRDHVVVGATVDEMLAAGYQPVGRDFPVFLHPTTHEEYALARTERKVAPGYAGFVFHADPTVTLEGDLGRRDLTVNAMAEDEATGDIVDPYGGRRDLEARLFRHVGPAFVEDPVRVLRVARFAARFTDFSVEADTLALMRRMAADGEIDALVPERVWQEVARGLMEARPSRMIVVLRDANAFGRLLPELERLFASGHGARLLDALDRAAAGEASLDVRFAVLLLGIGDGLHRDAARGAIDALSARLAVPRAARDLARVVAGEAAELIASADAPTSAATAAALVEAMERGDAFRRSERFGQAVEAIAWTVPESPRRRAFVDRMRRCRDATAAIDAGAIARASGRDPRRIADGLRAAREEAVLEGLRRHRDNDFS